MHPGPGDLAIGTRASPLALHQTALMEARLHAAGLVTRRVEITTTGDAVTDRPLSRIGSVALFTRQLDEALLAGRIDLAVHSLKDLPSRLPDGIALAAVSEREDPRDALVARDGAGLDALPPGAVVSTSSLRRRAQLLRHRPDLRIEDVRGNVETRLAKLEATPGWHATLLAAAGLIRLGLEDRITERLSCDVCVPAPGQGALAVTARAGDVALLHRLRGALHDARTGVATSAERGLLRALDGGCQVPIGARAKAARDGDGWRLTLHARVVMLDGSRMVEERLACLVHDEAEAWAAGEAAAEALRAQGADAILAAARRDAVP